MSSVFVLLHTHTHTHYCFPCADFFPQQLIHSRLLTPESLGLHTHVLASIVVEERLCFKYVQRGRRIETLSLTRSLPVTVACEDEQSWPASWVCLWFQGYRSVAPKPQGVNTRSSQEDTAGARPSEGYITGQQMQSQGTGGVRRGRGEQEGKSQSIASHLAYDLPHYPLAPFYVPHTLCSGHETPDSSPQTAGGARAYGEDSPRQGRCARGRAARCSGFGAAWHRESQSPGPPSPALCRQPISTHPA